MSDIRLAGVSKVWGSTRAVDDVTLTAPAGELLVLLGPSGCLSVRENILFGLTVRRVPRPERERRLERAVGGDAPGHGGARHLRGPGDRRELVGDLGRHPALGGPLLVAFLLFQRQFVQSFMRAGIR